MTLENLEWQIEAERPKVKVIYLLS